MINDWVQENLNWLITTGIAAVSMLVEISPIKINPWSGIAQLIGRALTRELMVEVQGLREEHRELKGEVQGLREEHKEMQGELKTHIRVSDESEVKQCRLRILRFNDELLQGTKHTKEHFDNILEDIDDYEAYCRSHPNYENNKAVLAIANCKKTYLQCVEDKSFL